MGAIGQVNPLLLVGVFASWVTEAAASSSSSLAVDEVLGDVSSIAFNTDVLVLCCTLLLAVVTASVCWPLRPAKIQQERGSQKTGPQQQQCCDSGPGTCEGKGDSVGEDLPLPELKEICQGQGQVIYITPEGRCFHTNPKCRSIASNWHKKTELRPCKICTAGKAFESLEG